MRDFEAKYMLINGEIKKTYDLLEWGAWFEIDPELSGRRIEATEIGDVRVSTVFLGLDHGWGEGPPVLFETMIFGGEHDQWQDRCCTLDEAKLMHKRAVWMVRGAPMGDDNETDIQHG